MKTTPATILALINNGKTNPKIRKIAVNILRNNNIKSTDYPKVIKAVAGWVHNNIMFVRDPRDTDIVHAPLENIQLGYGDCEDNVVVACSLLESLGLPTQQIIVSKTGDTWDHIFLRAGYPIDNPINWISVDTTISPPSGKEIPFVKERVYDTSKTNLGAPDLDLVSMLENLISPDIEKQVTEIYHPYEVSWLQNYAKKLGKVTGREMNYRAYVIPGDAINAFAIPGGSMYIYKGLIDKFPKGVVCGILGHEITHVARRHCINSYVAQYGIDFISGLFYQGKDKKIVEDILKLVALGYGREAEFEADKYSVIYNKKAGLYPFGLKHFLKWLVTTEKQPSSDIAQKIQTFLRTHPPATERLTRVNEEIAKLGIVETPIPITKATLSYILPIGIGAMLLLAAVAKKD